MGVNIGTLVKGKEVKINDLAGRVIGIDGYNVSYQFLARIRRSETGKLLRDNIGNVTSHLSGLFYRTSHLIEAGVKPLYVWDGKPPSFKEKTIMERKAVREEAEKKWVEALAKGEKAMVYAQASSKLKPEMVDESIKLLQYMGVPSIRAPSEGEAQLATMANEGVIWAGASQDWDSLLFNSPRLVRNLSITGRRKIPRKNLYVDIKPEIVELKKVLHSLGISREDLIVIGILIGTDYNAGVKGVGPKTALRLVKKYSNLDLILKHTKWDADLDIEKIFEFFLNPPTIKDYQIRWEEPNVDKIVELMVEEHDFSRRRVEKVVATLQERFQTTKEKPLEDFLG